jgi:predicted metal-binding protein
METAKKVTKVGIVICGNAANDMNCCSSMCLHDFQHGQSAFTGYGDGASELVGIISCAGCPTLAAPEKILHRVGALAALGAEAIHLSSCMQILCPFKTKYKRIIEEAFPKVRVVEGSHYPPEGTSPQEAGKQFAAGAHQMLCAPRPTMSTLARQLYPDLFHEA